MEENKNKPIKTIVSSFLCGFMLCTTLVLGVLFFLQLRGAVNIAQVIDRLQGETNIQRKIEDKTDTIEQYINRYYLDPIDEDKMADSIYKGIIDGLGDDYAAYYTKDEYETILEKTNGTYCGIGAYVSTTQDTSDIVIVKPMAGSPAQKAGIKAGDVIYAVDGEPVGQKDLNEVIALIKGKKGTKVTLKVIRKGEKDYLEYKIIRDEIKEETVAYRMLEGNIGYIGVSGFEQVTPEQFQTAISDLTNQNMKALMIDLRDNGGGLLSSAVSMLDIMLPKGLVVYTKDKSGEKETFYATNDDEITLPVAILVNENSASASEVFSGAMQDEQRAKLVGEKTFGKGIVQTIFDLSDGSALKMTTSKYYTPKGRNIHGTGLDPDIAVALDEKTVGKYDDKGNLIPDNQMEKAIEYLQGEVGK